MLDAKATLLCTEIRCNIEALKSNIWSEIYHWKYRNKDILFNIPHYLPKCQCCQSFLDSIHTFKLSSGVQTVLQLTLEYIYSVKNLHTYTIPPYPVADITFLNQETHYIRDYLIQDSAILLEKIKDFWPQAASIEISNQKDENANDKEPQAPPKTEA